MSQQIDITERLVSDRRMEDSVVYFIIHAITRWEAMTGKRWNHAVERPIVMKVDFRLNNIEMPFEEFLTDFYDQMDEMITNKAKELVNERLAGMFDNLYDFQKSIKAQMLEKFGYSEED